MSPSGFKNTPWTAKHQKVLDFCLALSAMFLFRAFLAFSLFIHVQYRNQALASSVVRSTKGDLFRNWKTSSRARTSDCEQKTCRDAQASCEGSTCCLCRCKAQDLRPTYVDSLKKCIGNSALPYRIKMSGKALLFLFCSIKKLSLLILSCSRRF